MGGFQIYISAPLNVPFFHVIPDLLILQTFW